jgi:2-phospho-L-lactate/phosphoenolpyruvate guanylyltransferase
MDAGLIPVKRLDRAKGRLAAAFGEAERVEIARALLEDVLRLAGAVDFLSWWVVSDDDAVRAEAAGRGLQTVGDDGNGLNAALRGGIEALTAAGATSVTVVPADVPLAWRGDLQDLLDTGATSDVVVVPSARDGGTNALYMSPPDLVRPRFGPDSLRFHIDEAARSGRRCSILALPRLGVDIDTVEDVDAFLARPRAGDTAAGRVLGRLRPSASG